MLTRRILTLAASLLMAAGIAGTTTAGVAGTAAASATARPAHLYAVAADTVRVQPDNGGGRWE
jgi:hypothetical protein